MHQLLKANHHHLTSSHLYVLNFERYDDPHLSLTLFEHASKLSPLFFPYILSSTTAAYYKLLKTQWDSFRDLRIVHPALEILANRVSRDSRARALVDDVRREAGARRTVWLEESETGSGEG